MKKYTDSLNEFFPYYEVICTTEEIFTDRKEIFDKTENDMHKLMKPKEREVPLPKESATAPLPKESTAPLPKESATAPLPAVIEQKEAPLPNQQTQPNKTPNQSTPLPKESATTPLPKESITPLSKEPISKEAPLPTIIEPKEQKQKE